MDTQRLILFVVFSISVLLLWENWQKASLPKQELPTPAAQRASGVPTPSAPLSGAAPTGTPSASAGAPRATGAAPALKGAAVTVRTDLIVAQIDTLGGSLTRLELRKQKSTEDPHKNFVLLDSRYDYSAESGLIGEGMPNHRSLWRLLPGPLSLAPGSDTLEVRFAAQGPGGLAVEKVYTFHRNSYVIDVAFVLRNQGTATVKPDAYFQLVRDDKPPEGEGSFMQHREYYGPAIYTKEHAYHKLDFADIEKGKAEYPKQARDGWIAMVQHYFVSAWIPAANTQREYFVKRLPDGLYSAGVILPVPQVAPGATVRVDAPLYSGPQEEERLKQAAPGLDLVVDYGWLSIIAWPLFAVLRFYHHWTGNWGVAIILLTVSVKLLFFPLSAASYRSMAKMKLVTPRMQKIREMYANDRAKMNQAMMELYKTEKINPLGGCLPIAVQIPVFIALYWVLLSSIELRNAPFIFWIKDLSALDPYYVLPVLMTISMVVQTRMNPKPPDPVQAKVMTFMPFVFSVMFFFFPAGLVLYWLVNNILSILQQWQIQRMFERGKAAHAKKR
ncbi:MAG: membrane protein insertase YidC [Betaproteobacteria bacterium]|nr:membrane protein insertase YidC [Betaproteobacteria bacterium]